MHIKHNFFFFFNVENDPVQTPPKCEGKARKGKWEEIQFEFRLSDTQKGSFLGEKRKYRR